MTTWVDVSQQTTTFTDAATLGNGYVVAGYVIDGYISGVEIWGDVSQVSGGWSAAGSVSGSWTVSGSASTTWTAA